MDINYDVITSIPKFIPFIPFILRRPEEAIYGDIIKIATMFLKKIFKFSK